MKETFWRLLKLALPIKNLMLLAAFTGVLTVASGIALMATSAYLISEAALHPSVAALSIAIVGVRFFGIARGVFRYVERLISHRATFRLLTNLRVWFYTALEPLVPARLMEYQRNQRQALSSGDLLRRIVADIDILQNFYIRIVAPPVIAALIGVAMWLFLGAFGAVFASTFLFFFLLSSAGIPLLTHLLSRQIGEQIISTKASLHTQLVDSVQGIADLTAFNQEVQQEQRIQQMTAELNKMQMKMAHISGLQGTLSNLFMNMTTWVMLLVAIPQVYDGRVSGVFLALLVLAALSSFEIVQPLPAAFQQLGGSLAAARRLFEIVDATPEVQKPQEASPVPHDYTIAARHLHFRYHSEEVEALSDLYFTIPMGHCLAIVGNSGAGKSTIARLLLRQWEYQEGEITLGGHELRRYHQEDLYRMVSIVEQDIHLFNTTIRENLLLARPGATDEEIIQASQQAQLHDFVLSLPDGYNTHIGEQGHLLSGGERQRIAIARAFLKDAPILILDEPTMHLDAMTERAILQTLRTLCQGRTTLLITHNFVEMDIADEILVLQQGRIVECGEHEQLLQKRGAYWRMWQQQQRIAQNSLQTAESA